MKPEVLVVDDTEEFRHLTAQYLAIEWPGAEVDEWDPRTRGGIPDFYPLGGYDALLLDSDLGSGDALEWLGRLVKRKDCPPVVFMVDPAHESAIFKAMQRGAFDYLRKSDLSKTRLVEAVRAAFAARSSRPSDSDARQAAAHRAFLNIDIAMPGATRRPDAHPVAINGYRMLDKIGSGGMSTVYLAERIDDGLRLVMKIMDTRLADNNEFLMRFIQEYGLLSKIHCPQVVRIHDQGVTDRHVYIAMEHFSGGDLRSRIRRGLTPDEAVGIMKDVARALSAVHGHGIVHRDLKPDNVMFRADGSLAIADFGIATKSAEGVDLTAHGDVLGTPHYLSPEQACARPLDGRSDLYSLGIVFFEMLTGRRPFQAKDAVGLAHKHVSEPLPRLPAEFARYQELVDCLTAKRPADRFAGARELLDYLETHATTLSSATNATRIAPPSVKSDEAYQFDNALSDRAPSKDSSDPVPSRTQNRTQHWRTAPGRVLDADATLARLGGDGAVVRDVVRIFKRTVTPLLVLLAGALNDGNLHFVYEAALLLKGAIAAVEAPEVSQSVAELEVHAKARDIDAALSAFDAMQKLTRRMMLELAKLAGAR